MSLYAGISFELRTAGISNTSSVLDLPKSHGKPPEYTESSAKVDKDLVQPPVQRSWNDRELGEVPALGSSYDPPKRSRKRCC